MVFGYFIGEISISWRYTGAYRGIVVFVLVEFSHLYWTDFYAKFFVIHFFSIWCRFFSYSGDGFVIFLYLFLVPFYYTLVYYCFGWVYIWCLAYGIIWQFIQDQLNFIECFRETSFSLSQLGALKNIFEVMKKHEPKNWSKLIQRVANKVQISRYWSMLFSNSFQINHDSKAHEYHIMITNAE